MGAHVARHDGTVRVVSATPVNSGVHVRTVLRCAERQEHQSAIVQDLSVGKEKNIS